MSSWAKTDAFGSAPLWALARVKKAPVASNMGAAASGKLFNNASANNLISGVTVGLFNNAAGEIIAGSHQGWVLKTTGSGGRAGRITGETLVALTSNT
jgi:hypothetical protein